MPPTETFASPTVDVVVVSYHSAATLGECVKSARAAPGVGRVVVVDNASTDDSVAVARAAGAEVIASKNNAGFAVANNLGAKTCTAPVLLFLNPDALLPPGGAALLAQALLADATLGAATLPMVYPGGAPQQSAFAFPTLASIFWQNLGLLGCLTRWGIFRQPQHGDVDWVLGACLAMRREVFEKTGGWNERFFLYQEDTDLCKRLHRLGLAVKVLDGPAVVHVGKTPGTDHGPATAYFNQAILTYFREHHGPLGRFLAALFFALGHTARWGVFGLARKPDRSRFEKKNALFFWKKLLGN